MAVDRPEMSKGAEIVARLSDTRVPPNVSPMLAEALYTLSETGEWPDNVDRVSPDQAILCWKLVEWLKTLEYFPTNLRM